MKKNKVYSLGYILIPALVAFVAAYMKSLWLALGTVFLNFFLVSVLSQCKRRETLYMFIMVAVSSVFINWFVIENYFSWMSWISGNKGIHFLCMLLQVLILSGIEEIMLCLVTRIIWKKQYRIFPD